MTRKTILLVVSVLVLNYASAAQTYEPIEQRITAFQQGWGELGFDESVHQPDKKGGRLQIKDKLYDKGLGTHAQSDIAVDLNGEFQTFEAQIGVQWQDSKTSVVFQVFVDGQKRFDSGIIKEQDQARAISVNIAGGQEMMLVVTDAGDGITGDAANWADARLIRSETAEPKIISEPFDIAGFARVVTYDPNRKASNPGRTEELNVDQIFLETEVVSGADGSFTVPVGGNGWDCIGLQWCETRILKELAVDFAENTQVPEPNKAVVQWWVGESLYQGHWQSLRGQIIQQGSRMVFPIDWRNVRLSPTGQAKSVLGVQRIRWLFPPTDKPIIVRKLEAFTHSRWDTVALRFELEGAKAGDKAKLGIYNGQLLEQTGNSMEWQVSKPLEIKVRYCKSGKGLLKTNRTLINLQLPDEAFSVLVDDVLENGCVYVRQFGLFVTTEPSKYTLEEYRREIAGRETVIEKVRKMPDQSYKQAMSRVNHDIQKFGPTMLSLACDNNKYLVQRDGAISFADNAWLRGGILVHHLGNFKYRPRFGSGKNENLTRYLLGRWQPITVTAIEEDGIIYSQMTYVAPYGEEDTQAHPWLARKPVCVVEISIKNTLTHSSQASAKLTFLADVNQAGKFRDVDGGFILQNDDKLFVFADTGGVTSFKAQSHSGYLMLSGLLPAQTTQRCVLYIPSWAMKPDEYACLNSGRDLLDDTKAYWNKIMTPVTQVEVPEPLLMDVIRASQVHCLIAARNEDNGRRFAPWIASWWYGPFESEAHSIIRGLDLFGHEDFARRGLDFFINKYNKAGYLTTGYTWLGLGWHLWTLGEHYQRTKNTQWLRDNAPELMRVSRWIIDQRDKTKKLDAHGEKLPEYGLMPPGVAADWNRFGYRWYLQGNFYAGLSGAGKALTDINYPDADELFKDAAEFRQDIQRAFDWAAARTPVVPLSNGTWVPFFPTFLYCFGLASDIFPGEDWNRVAVYDTELGSHCLAPLGLLDAGNPKIDSMINYMEDVEFFRTNEAGDFPIEENKKDWFNLGGFSKMQAYYTRIQDIYAMRDDVKPFIRSYFNPSTALLNTENLWFWECFHNMGAWNKTHETGWFLCQTRTMLLNERGDELWLAPFVTNHWTKDGMVVAVRNAPTRFGKVSYKITSCVDKGYIEAVIEPPTRSMPKALVIRLRHPDEKLMKKVTVNGCSYTNFNPEKEYIRLEPATSPITLRAEY